MGDGIETIRNLARSRMNVISIQKSLTYLRSEIKASAWLQKERLPPVRILARQAQVSAAAMCSALGILREEGVVSIIKNRGAYLGASPAANRKDRDYTPWSTGQRWQRLKTQIESDIFNGFYAAGEPMPSLRDLEKSYSVSYKTLHKALESIAAEGLITPSKKTYRIPPLRKTHATLAFISVAGASSLISFGGYPHTEFLSALRREGGKSLINIAMCVYHPEKSVEDFANQLKALREKHSVLGYVLWVSKLPDQKLNQLVQILRKETKRPLKKQGKENPLAVVDTITDHPTTQFLRQQFNPENTTARFFSVAGLMAGRQAGQYLLKLGHRQTAFLSYCHKELWSQQRYRGLLQAYQSAGFGEGVQKFVIDEMDDDPHALPAPPDIEKYLKQADAFVSTSEEAGLGHYAAYALEQLQGAVSNFIHQLKMAERVEPVLNAILEQPGITACVAANDRMALLVRDHLLRKGMRISKDISVISFDDSKAATDNDLSSYSFAFAEIARKVLTYVLAPRPKHPVRDDSFVECEGLLIERGSSGIVRSGKIPEGMAG